MSKSEQSQLDRFKEADRELKADDCEALFNEKPGWLVQQRLDANEGRDK